MELRIRKANGTGNIEYSFATESVYDPTDKRNNCIQYSSPEVRRNPLIISNKPAQSSNDQDDCHTQVNFTKKNKSYKSDTQTGVNSQQY